MSNSPEQMDEPREEEMAETPASPEVYDEAEWNRLKQGGPAFAINKGKEMGVPQEELDRFAQDVIAREIENQNYGLVYRFRKNMGIGTEEEIRAAGEKWDRVNEAHEMELKKVKVEEKRKEEEREDEERELTVTISKDATFADLFKAIDAVEEKEGMGALYFEEELVDIDSDLAREVFAFRDEQEDKAATTKVLDFFEERGYSQDEISIFLPIRFE